VALKNGVWRHVRASLRGHRAKSRNLTAWRTRMDHSASTDQVVRARLPWKCAVSHGTSFCKLHLLIQNDGVTHGSARRCLAIHGHVLCFRVACVQVAAIAHLQVCAVCGIFVLCEVRLESATSAAAGVCSSVIGRRFFRSGSERIGAAEICGIIPVPLPETEKRHGHHRDCVSSTNPCPNCTWYVCTSAKEAQRSHLTGVAIR
jgi:hypothetical protein